MKSSISIDKCISSIRTTNGLEADERREAIRENILKELHAAICRARSQNQPRTGKIMVHVLPRRFQFYGSLDVFEAVSEGAYRLNLPYESWIKSDRNLSRNELSILIE
jgi:hypothetical protein